jgi:hypothetical protein
MRKLKLGAASGLLLLAGAIFGSTAGAAEKIIDGVAAQQRSENAAKEIAATRALLAESEGILKAAPNRDAAKSATDPVVKALTPRANAYRTYAPSCLAYPLPEQFSGPLYPPNASFRVLLAARDINVSNQFFEEIVNVRLWRIPCSSSGEFYDSVTLLAIDRDAPNEGNANRYPLFPGLRVTQGNNTRKLVRVADEPNTVVSHIFADEPLINSGTYVLENFASTSSQTAVWDFNNQFTLTFLNFFAGDPGQSISVATYNPTQQTYPDAFGNIPITGYLTGNWFDEAHSGEGMLVQVFDLPNNSTQVLFTFAWFTYGPDGRPFWLFGASPIARDTRGPIDVPTIFHSNGGFAGQFGPSTTTSPWGSVRFSFPTCYEMRFRYSSTTTAAGVPQGTGEKTWVRTVDTNGITCE